MPHDLITTCLIRAWPDLLLCQHTDSCFIGGYIYLIKRHKLDGEWTGWCLSQACMVAMSLKIFLLQSSSVTLSNVPYGINGSWAINLWIRSMGELNGIERVFSHSAETLQDTLPSLWGPNQVKLQSLRISHSIPENKAFSMK